MPAYQATRVVIFSAARKAREEERCLQLGANAYVQKPSNLDPFFAAVKTIVNTWLQPSGY
jgi:DNA-binding NarL/FixJ family response regulator